MDTPIPLCVPDEIEFDSPWRRAHWPCGAQWEGTEDVRVALREHVCSDFGREVSSSPFGISLRTSGTNRLVPTSSPGVRNPTDKGNHE